MLSDFSLFKDLEAAEERYLPPKGLVVFRLDGSNFRTFTKQFEKPFSNVFERGMDNAAREIVEHVLPRTLITYVGSDEISLVVSAAVAELPYGARVNKLLSLSAAHATAGFMKMIPELKGVPAFDARFILLEEPELIREYITWRRLDVRKNATSMAAGHLHSHKDLLGVSTSARGELLVGTPFEKIPEETFNGRFVSKDGSVAATRELTEEITREAAELHGKALAR